MKDCAKRLGVNYSTAKHILKVYRKTGSIETDLMKKRKLRSQRLKEKAQRKSEVKKEEEPVVNFTTKRPSGFVPYKRVKPIAIRPTVKRIESSPEASDINTQ